MMENFKFISILRETQYNNDIYIVGGTVRDMLVGKDPVDIDIVVPSDVEGFTRALSQKIKGTPFLLDKQRGIFRIATKDKTPPFFYDISPMRGENILADLSLRDFTMDALAVNLASASTIIDPYNGELDIKRRCIRVVSSKSFEDDPLRLLRAFRLSATLEFDIVPDTLERIREMSSSLRLVASERIRDEFFRLLSSAKSIHYLKDMYKAGLLTGILSGLDEADTERGLSVLERLEQLYRCLHPLLSPDDLAIEGYLMGRIEEGITTGTLWKWISLYVINNITEGLMKRAIEGMRLGSRAYRLALTGLQNIQTNILDKGVKDKRSLYHLFKSTGDDGIGLILYKLASTAEVGESYDKALQNAREAISWYLHEYKEIRATPLVTGDDLIKLFHLTPGPLFSRLLNAVEEKMATGDLVTKDDAISYLKRLLTGL